MKLLKTISILITISFIGCAHTPPAKPNQSVFLFRDKDGLYQYNFETGKEKLLHKVQDWEVFLDEPCKVSGDTITFGMVGQLANSTQYEGLHYTNYYMSVNLKTGKSRVSREIKYSTDIADKLLTIKILDNDSESRQKIVSDTTMPYRGYVDSYRGMIFNDEHPRFYSEHTLGNKKTYSENGSLYCNYKTERGSETDLLIENKQFDPKFGNGYMQPQLDPTETYILFTFLPGFLKQGASLQKIRLADKKIEVIKEGQFADPVFSDDGKFVLFRRNLEENKNKAWESEIYILDLKTLKETKIGQAGLAQWKHNNKI
jgi:hypothetical protein